MGLPEAPSTVYGEKKRENRLSKHSMSLIISNRALDKGLDRFVINSVDIFTFTQHNHKMGVVSDA